MKCVAYARVSTDSKDQENSFDNQKSYFENRLSNTEGYSLVSECGTVKDGVTKGIYADKGLTGTKLNNRPEFNQMLKDAGIDVIETYTSKDRRLKKKHIIYEVSEREPKFDEIWIKNTSRFARNTLSFEIIQKLRDKGVHIYFVEQNINTKDVGSDFLLKLFQLFDEQDSRDKSLKVSSGIREGARRGKISSNSKLFGYQYIQSENRLEIIPEEAEIVRLIYSLYTEGYGIRRIINKLDERGITTRLGKSFVKNTIKMILINEKYAGRNERLKYNTGTVFHKESYPKLRPVGERMPVETDKIPAIISGELFDQCQELLKGKVNYINQKGIYKGFTEYGGLIYCGVCGKAYNGNVDRGKRFYNCSTKKKKGTGVCSNKNIYVKDLQALLTSDIYWNLRMTAIEEVTKVLNKIILDLLDRLKETQFDRIKELEIKVAELQEEAKRLILVFTKNLISEAEFAEAKLPLDISKKELEAELNSLKTPKDKVLEDIEESRKAMRRIANMELKDTYTEEEIIEGIERIYIYPANYVKVEFKPFIDDAKVKLDPILVEIKYDNTPQGNVS